MSEDWLDWPRRLEETGHRDSALDFIYDVIDDMLLAKQFNDVDLLLQECDTEKTSTLLLVGLLTITLAASPHLPSRSEFFKRVYVSIENRGEMKENLLYGLG